jgi:hypothetical protein
VSALNSSSVLNFSQNSAKSHPNQKKEAPEFIGSYEEGPKAVKNKRDKNSFENNKNKKEN